MAKNASVLRIQQVRSRIGQTKKQREALRTLGLRRIGQVVEQPDNAAVRGNVVMIGHLVRVVGAVPAAGSPAGPKAAAAKARTKTTTPAAKKKTTKKAAKKTKTSKAGTATTAKKKTTKKTTAKKKTAKKQAATKRASGGNS